MQAYKHGEIQNADILMRWYGFQPVSHEKNQIQPEANRHEKIPARHSIHGKGPNPAQVPEGIAAGRLRLWAQLNTGQQIKIIYI